MKKQQKLLVLAIITAFIATALFLPGLVSAGDLEPDAAPGSTMHTLDEIYNKLDQLVPGGGLASVEKTGQTTSHETGDDGDLSKGVTWPNPRFTDNNDGTVTDNLTGLVWLKDANRFGSTNWADALIACNALAADGTNLTDGSSAGDWRLPNIKELQSLIDYGSISPCLPDGYPFEEVQSNVYWSSTTYAGSTYDVWFVYMVDGSVNIGSKFGNNYVWPVRSDN
ncbi:MAG: DUF1566 domain-containing protein [Deltaproteobacteria bacterium]|jgi:hypothetical protein|nr:DUF1566 domain-containing protein [Deltaproteobacteria bacterium]